MLHPCDTWYTDRQHPIYQRLSFSHNGGIFARFSVGGQTGEVESLIDLGCLFVSLETAVNIRVVFRSSLFLQNRQSGIYLVDVVTRYTGIAVYLLNKQDF